MPGGRSGRARSSPSALARAALALASIAALAAPLHAQSLEPPAPQESGRLYRVGLEALRDEGRLADTLDRLESANPERRIFVLIASEGSPEAIARATAAAWTRAAAADARLPWKPDSSFLVVATARAP